MHQRDSQDTRFAVDILRADNIMMRSTKQLVKTPHRPLIVGLSKWKMLKSLAFAINGHFQS